MLAIMRRKCSPGRYTFVKNDTAFQILMIPEKLESLSFASVVVAVSLPQTRIPCD
jgi:hypothetical protein